MQILKLKLIRLKYSNNNIYREKRKTEATRSGLITMCRASLLKTIRI